MSGVATVATSASACRPSFLPSIASFRRSASVNRIRLFPTRSFRARFTAFRYSIWSGIIAARPAVGRVSSGKRRRSEDVADSVTSAHVSRETVHVFVSSTWHDLRPERNAVETAIHRLREARFTGMEYFGSRDETPAQTSLDDLDRSQVYVGIFAGRYGSGVTEAEYRRARELGLPCLIYLKEADTILPDGRETDQGAADRLQALTRTLQSTHTITTFRTPDDLAAKITADLHRWLFDHRPPAQLERIEGEDHSAAVKTLPAPHQLRAPLRDFVGRVPEIERLTEVLGAPTEATAAVTCIRGMGGIGKTELGFTVAHRVSNTFADAQVVVNMQGTSDAPLTPVQALQKVLRDFGATANLSDDLEALQGRYRTLLSGKRVLILADDASDAVQVRPLLPPPGCALIVTSRNRFLLEGTRVLDLEALPRQYAEGLLLALCPTIGQQASKMAELCGYLPLAIRIAAGMLQNDSSLSPGAFVDRLESERTAYLQDPEGEPDVHSSVEFSIDLSFRSLDPDHQRALCQLAVFPSSFRAAAAELLIQLDDRPPAETGTPTSAAARTAWIDQHRRRTVDMLGALLRRNLLGFDKGTDRYDLHDLVRDFGIRRLPRMDDVDAVRLRHARVCFRIAMQTEIYAQKDDDKDLALVEALEGFALNRPHIDAAWRWLEAHAPSEHTDRLLALLAVTTRSIAPFQYDNAGERGRQLHLGLEAARRLGEKECEGIILHDLGTISNRESATRSVAVAQFTEALALFESLTPEVCSVVANLQEWQSMCLNGLAGCHAEVGEWPKALACYERIAKLERQRGKTRREAAVQEKIGMAYHQLGDRVRAIRYLEQAQATAGTASDPDRVHRLYWTLGMLYSETGDLRRAVALGSKYVQYLDETGQEDHGKYGLYLEHLREKLRTEVRERLAQAKPGDVLFHFPGMPALTYNVKTRVAAQLPNAVFYLEKDDQAVIRRTPDIEAYGVFIDGDPIGRFTIRWHGGQVLRNFFCKLTSASTTPPEAVTEGSHGHEGPPLLENIRIASEHARILFSRAARRSHAREYLMNDSPLTPPRIFPSRSFKKSLLDLYLRHTVVTTKTCGIDGERFALPKGRVEIYSAYPEGWAVDIGGHCSDCEAFLCEKHLDLVKSSETTRLSLVCRKHRTQVGTLTEFEFLAGVTNIFSSLSVTRPGTPSRESWWRRWRRKR